MKNLQGVTNHPVHIQNEDGTLSPTALIPFCEFGGNMSIMGVKIDKFDVPVCKSFRPKIIQDQLCYTVDPNEYRKYFQRKQKLGLTLFINYDYEDRELLFYDNSSHKEQFIIVESIGKIIQKNITLF